MKKREVDHVLRAAGRITGEKQFIIIGSQALHGKYPDLADQIVKSVEVDLLATKNPARTEWLNSIGIYSPFHENHGYYADPVDDKTATLPKGWKGRLVNLPPGETEGVKGLCLEPHDLAIAKYAASREKDLVFNRELAQRGLLSRERLFSLLDQTPIDDEARQRIRGQIELDFTVEKQLTAERAPAQPMQRNTPLVGSNDLQPSRGLESDGSAVPARQGQEDHCGGTKGVSELSTAVDEVEDSRRRGREDWLKMRQQRLESGAPTLEEIRAQGREDWLKLREQRRQQSPSPDDDRTRADHSADLGRDKQGKDSGSGIDDDLEQ